MKLPWRKLVEFKMEIDVELNRRSGRSESNVCDRNDDENRVAYAEGQGSHSRAKKVSSHEEL